MYYSIYSYRDIKLIIVGRENAITQLVFFSHDKLKALMDKGYVENDNCFIEATKQLNEYHDGLRISFDLPLEPKGTDFQKQVWKALTMIPYGETYSYKEVAGMVGNDKASRAVGMANNKNPIPIIIPCHRVIGSNGKLVGYAGGIELKVRLINIEKINMIYDLLLKEYGMQDWWPAESDIEMMISAILTQNTNWSNVEKAIRNLKEHLGGNLTIEDIANVNVEILAELIRPSGYYNQKALKIINLIKWLNGYQNDLGAIRKGDKTALRNELLDIKGIGRETADCILTYALEKPSFVIDAYTRRVFERLGFDVPNDYDDFRHLFEESLEDSLYKYNEYHALLVRHCKEHCTKKPNCVGCPLVNMCRYGQKAIESQ